MLVYRASTYVLTSTPSTSKSPLPCMAGVFSGWPRLSRRCLSLYRHFTTLFPACLHDCGSVSASSRAGDDRRALRRTLGRLWPRGLSVRAAPVAHQCPVVPRSRVRERPLCASRRVPADHAPQHPAREALTPHASCTGATPSDARQTNKLPHALETAGVPRLEKTQDRVHRRPVHLALRAAFQAPAKFSVRRHVLLLIPGAFVHLLASWTASSFRSPSTRWKGVALDGRRVVRQQRDGQASQSAAVPTGSLQFSAHQRDHPRGAGPWRAARPRGLSPRARGAGAGLSRHRSRGRPDRARPRAALHGLCPRLRCLSCRGRADR